MTKENPNKKEDIAEFKVSDDQVQMYLNRIKTIEALKDSEGVPEKVKVAAKGELIDIVKTLWDAAADRKAVYKKLKKNRKPDSSEILKKIEEIELVFGEIKDSILIYFNDKSAIDEGVIDLAVGLETKPKEAEGVEGKLNDSETVEFKTPDNVLAVYSTYLKKAHDLGNKEAFDIYIGKLNEAKKERLPVIEKLEKNPDLIIKDDVEQPITLDQLKKEIKTIEDLLSTYTNTIEKEKKTEVFQKNIESEKISGTQDGVSEELKNYRYTSIVPQIKEYMGKLRGEITHEEKTEIKKFVEDLSEKTQYRKSVLDSDNVLDIGSKEYKGIERAIKNLVELSKLLNQAKTKEVKVEEASAEEPAVEEMEKDIEDINIPVAEPVVEENKTLESERPELTPEEKQRQIDLLTPGGFSADKLHKKLGGTKNLTEPGNEEDNESENEDDENNEPEPEFFESFDSIIKSIIKNENPEARFIFLTEHKNIQKDLLKQIESIKEKEGGEALNTFITEQQEQINSLIKLLEEFGSYDKTENQYLLNALKSDLRLLKKEIVKVEVEEPENDKPQPATNTNTESKDINPRQINLDELLSPERMEVLKSNAKLYKQLTKAIEDYNQAVAIDPNSEITKECLKDVTKLNEKFLKYEKGDGNHNFDNQNFEPINQPEGESLAIMQSNKDLFNRVYEAVELYNNQLKAGADKKTLGDLLNEVTKLQQEFAVYKEEFLKKINKGKGKGKKNKQKKPEQVGFYNEDEDFDTIAKHISQDRKNENQTEPQPTTKTEPDTHHSPNPEEEPRIFYTEEGQNYQEISNNKGFDTWLENITASIKKGGISIESEIKSLDDWYAEYQDALPYKEKLDKIFEDVKKKEGANKVALLMTQEKVADLLYGIHTSGESGKEKIDQIFKMYQESKDLAEKRLVFEKSKELREKIQEDRSKTGKMTELNANQVKSILESRGQEGTEENINEMVAFLQDLDHNYADFYANNNEHVDNDMMHIYKRYRAASGKKPGAKIGGVKKLWSRFTGTLASAFKDVDAIDYQNTKNLIVKARELNLVDRKIGSRDQALTNKAKMEKLIAFTRGQKMLLVEHVQNPKSNKAETLDQEQKEMLNLFDSMYKTFTESKYSGVDAKEKAEEILSSNTSLRGSEPLGEPMEIIDTLFESESEAEVFEINATRQVAKEWLVNLKTELEKFPKTGKHIPEWKKLTAKFDKIKTVFEALGDDTEDDIDMKIVKLKIEDLDVRHINKDVYKDLSASFVIYEKIVNSPDRTVTEKQKYVNDLLQALEKHRSQKTNTKIQNGVLDDTIKKYKEILKNIK